MSILDKVYTTFSNLDKDYARTKKTRTEFITEKFGGDINTGSVIILDAIREEGLEENVENIAKMSYIKDIFNRIKSCADRLDTLQSFNFVQSDVATRILSILRSSNAHETRQNLVAQSSLWAGNARCLHHVCTADGASYADMDACKVFNLYNENMYGLLSGVFTFDGDPQLTTYYKVALGNRLKKIQEGAVAKNLR